MFRDKLDELAYKIHKMGLGTVAIFFLESMKPLNNVVFNVGLFSKPFAEVFLREDIYREILEIIKDKGSLEYLITRLEELEDGMVGNRTN